MTTIGGNISVRLSDNRFLITATGIPLDELNEENIIVIDKEGNSQEKNFYGFSISSLAAEYWLGRAQDCHPGLAGRNHACPLRPLAGGDLTSKLLHGKISW